MSDKNTVCKVRGYGWPDDCWITDRGSYDASMARAVEACEHPSPPRPPLSDDQIAAIRSLAREFDDEETIALCHSALDVAMTRGGEMIDPRSPDECRAILTERNRPLPTSPKDRP